MSFVEVDEEESAAADDEEGEFAAPLDLTGVPSILHDTLRALVEVDGRKTIEERDIPAARAVHLNKDGTVAVSFIVPVKVDGEEHPGVRLRPMAARDYFDGTTEAIANDISLVGTLRFASHLAMTKRVVGEVACAEDMNALYFGVMAVRKNFSRPRR